MKLTIEPLDKEAEKHLLHTLAEVALEVGREVVDSKARKERNDDKESRRVLPCIDSLE